MELKLDGRILPVTICRSQRKTWQLKISPNGEVLFRGPERLTDAAVRKLLDQHRDWISTHLRSWEERRQQRPGLVPANGSRFPFLGQEYPLEVAVWPGLQRSSARLRGGMFRISVPSDDHREVRAVLERWYAVQAKRILPERTRQAAQRIGLTVNRIAIKDQKSRWGSCSSKGNVNLNWRLLMMPEAVMDSIIMHELAHRVHPDHSPDFYRYLGVICPDYETGDAWLRQNGYRLYF